MTEQSAYLVSHPRPIDLASGRLVATGAEVQASDLNLEDPHDLAHVEQGRLVPFNPTPLPWELEGDDLKAAAKDAEIKGYTTMKADDLRRALYDHFHPEPGTGEEG